MNTWYCQDCQTYNCDGKQSHPYKVARIDAKYFCIKFWNPQSEPIFQYDAINRQRLRSYIQKLCMER